jgi:hypothetical protein
MCLAGSDIETSVEVGRKFVSVLYDPKGAAKSAHDNLHELRVKSALAKDASLVRLPPSEAAFKQHILRVSLQVYVWILQVQMRSCKNSEDIGPSKYTGFIEPSAIAHPNFNGDLGGAFATCEFIQT